MKSLIARVVAQDSYTMFMSVIQLESQAVGHESSRRLSDRKAAVSKLHYGLAPDIRSPEETEKSGEKSPNNAWNTGIYLTYSRVPMRQHSYG